MAFDESKVKRDKAGRFSRTSGSKAKNRNIGATAKRPKGNNLAGIWDTAPYDKPKPKHRPGQTPEAVG